MTIYPAFPYYTVKILSVSHVNNAHSKDISDLPKNSMTREALLPTVL